MLMAINPLAAPYNEVMNPGINAIIPPSAAAATLIAPANKPNPIANPAMPNPTFAQSGIPANASLRKLATLVTAETIPTIAGVNGTMMDSNRLDNVIDSTCHASSSVSTLFARSS